MLLRLIICFFFVFGNALYAAESTPSVGFLPTESVHASWVFSGVVTSEDGGHYGYFFQMQRHGDQLNTVAALMDGQSNRIVFLDESQAVVHESNTNKWRVGGAFLQFNPINDSWIFGLKTKDQKGFNFKVDMSIPSENPTVVQSLRQGVELLVSQTSHLNGHIHVGNGQKEQFVTGKNAWFRQIWLTGSQEKSHPLTGVLCRFNDGSGFYSANMLSPDAMRGAVAGWCDAAGVSTTVSQFINVKQAADGPWHIRIASPTHHLVLTDFITQSSIVAGFLTEGKTSGFCMLSQDMIGEQKTA